jgi:crossover junction endodeoxyribonuclease RuvC
MRVLGIDPGTAIVGYGIVDYNKNIYKNIKYGCIYTDKTLDLETRLFNIYEELDLLIKEYKPDAIAIEELFFFKNAKTVISVGQARGVIVVVSMKNKLKPVGYTPLQVKMGVTGYGKAEKKQIQEMVQKILKLEKIPEPDDAADGLAIAITHINSLTSLYLVGEKTTLSSKAITKNKMSLKDYREIILKK